MPSTYHAFYLSRVTKDGTATFSASDRIAGTITLDGKAKAGGRIRRGKLLGQNPQGIARVRAGARP